MLGVSVAVTLQTLTLSSLVRSQYPLPCNVTVDLFKRAAIIVFLGDRNEAKENRART